MWAIRLMLRRGGTWSIHEIDPYFVDHGSTTSTSWVDGSGCGFMSMVTSSVSSLCAPIPGHIEVVRPDVDPALSGSVLVGDVV